MTIFLMRHIRTSQTENDSVTAAAASNCKTVIYMFAFMRAAVCNRSRSSDWLAVSFVEVQSLSIGQKLSRVLIL